MGAEAKCRATIDGAICEGHVLLESTEIVFRANGKRVVIPFERVTKATAKDGVLLVMHASGAAAFELGPRATQWAEKMRSPKPLLDKLGVRPAMQVVLLGVRDEAFVETLRARCERVHDRVVKNADIVFFGAEQRDDLKRMSALRKTIAPTGAVWVVRPKGSDAIGEGDVRAAGLAAGLVDVKVVAFSATHSALKFVVPVAKRVTGTDK